MLNPAPLCVIKFLMRFLNSLLISAVALLSAGVCGAAHFPSLGQIPVRSVLPAPPSADSLATQAELEIVIQLERERTPQQTEWARNPPTGDVFAYARSILGPWFTAANLPATAAFFAKIDEDGGAILTNAKSIYPVRERPFIVEPRIAMPTSRPGGSTYPSGAGYNTAVWASLLTTIFPEHADAFRERARFACWTRVLAGVHYPTDNTGGRILGDAVAKFLLVQTDVQAAIAAVREELQGAARK